MKKVYIVVGILVVLAVVHVFVAGCSPHKNAENASADQSPSNTAIKEPPGKEITDPKELAALGTMRQLSRMKEYPNLGAEMLYHLDDEGNYIAESLYGHHRIEANQIFRNRIFRDVLRDLGKLSKNRVSELLAGELEDALSKYLELYNGSFENPSLKIFSVPVEESADGPPVFLGLRNKIFALILIAGSLELTDIHERIKNIDAIAKKQDIEIRRSESKSVRTYYLLDASLHNNLVLASGLYGTSPRKGDAGLKPFGDRFAERQVANYFYYGNVTESYNIRYFDKMTFKDLDELRRVLGSP